MPSRTWRRTLAAVAVAALLTTAGCAGVLGSAPAGSLNDTGNLDGDAYRTGSAVFVTASGQAKTDPDEAVVRVAVETTGDTAQVARQKLADNTSRMRQALLDMGLEEDQLTTIHYDIRQDYRRGPEEKEPERQYRGFHMLEITLTDLDRVGTVIDTAVDNGATRVDGVRFTLTRETRQELEQEALSDAMGNAKAKATTLADAAELELQQVHEVRTGQDGGQPRYVEAMATPTAGGDGGTSVDTGPVTVTASVSVSYNATAA